MTEAFTNLPQEKQESIIKAAMAEFAANGYKRTSTNQIVKAAGIGKGMLFYYFGSKLELYNDLIDCAFDFVKEHMEGIGEHFQGKPDILQYFKLATQIKMKAMMVNPTAFDFMTRLYLHPEELEISDETKRRFDRMMKLRDSVISSIFAEPDLSVLRKDIEANRLLKYLNWGIEGYVQSLITQIQKFSDEELSKMDLTPYWKEFDQYLEDLKLMYYE